MSQVCLMTCKGNGVWLPTLGKLRQAARHYHKHRGLRAELLQGLLTKESPEGSRKLLPGAISFQALCYYFLKPRELYFTLSIHTEESHPLPD